MSESKLSFFFDLTFAKKKTCLNLIQLYEKSEEISFLCPQILVIWFAVFVYVIYNKSSKRR